MSNDIVARLRADLDAYQKERDEEVVRLRAELAAFRNTAVGWERMCRVAEAERDTLRALLREALDNEVWPDGLSVRIDAALNKGGGDE